MKIYLIYKKYREDRCNNPSSLYAFTKDKHLKDEFMKVRDKNQFVVVDRYMDSDTYLRFIDRHHNYLLGNRNYRNSNNDIIQIVSTCGEELDVFIKSDKIFEELLKYIDDFSYAYNETINKALNLLHYNMFRMYKGEDNYYNMGYNGYDDSIPRYPFTGELKVNQVGMFAYLFGNTFDVKKL